MINASNEGICDKIKRKNITSLIYILQISDQFSTLKNDPVRYLMTHMLNIDHH